MNWGLIEKWIKNDLSDRIKALSSLIFLSMTTENNLSIWGLWTDCLQPYVWGDRRCSVYEEFHDSGG